MPFTKQMIEPFEPFHANFEWWAGKGQGGLRPHSHSGGRGSLVTRGAAVLTPRRETPPPPLCPPRRSNPIGRRPLGPAFLLAEPGGAGAEGGGDHRGVSGDGLT